MSIIIQDIINTFETWAPKWAAMDYDNVGLQVGNTSKTVKNILISLDITNDIIEEAILKKVDLIITHHPLIFKPQKHITSKDNVGNLILKLAENKIALYSAHTNLDCSKDGVSFSLANLLNLKDIKFLEPLKDTLVKIAVFVPKDNVEDVAKQMSKAGAGIIGNYTECSFRTQGTGSFLGNNLSNPKIGKKGILEYSDEVKLEMIAPKANINAIIDAIKTVHPYEEVAYDIYNIKNDNINFGMGAIGVLPKPIKLKLFLKNLKSTLGCSAVCYSGKLESTIKKVAVCGGAGSDLLHSAIAAKADVFVTADIKYSSFHQSANKIALVDAGHFETEQVILRPILEFLNKTIKMKHKSISISISKINTNPIRTF